MIDLRLYADDLIGKKITIAETKVGNEYLTKRDYTITEVYRSFVKAEHICDNGYRLAYSFDTGDLIIRGIIKTPQRVTDRNAAGIREGYS